LDIYEIVTLECVSNSLKCSIAECSYWPRNILLYCPHISIDSIPRIEFRDTMVKHIIKKNQCIEFIMKMKNQRGVQRQDSIQPHRHNKNERSVTHPLPIFDSRNNLSNTSGNMIMSRTETLNSDFRSVAQKTLEIMFHITNCCIDHIVHTKLASEGVITVLVSLLSNEAGILQHYSCGILANMLVWECHRNNMINYQLKDNNSNNNNNNNNNDDDNYNNYNNDDENFNRNDSVNNQSLLLPTPLAKQLHACGGQGLLMGKICILITFILFYVITCIQYVYVNT
jgi:hypothetical protein